MLGLAAAIERLLVAVKMPILGPVDVLGFVLFVAANGGSEVLLSPKSSSA